MRLLLAFVAVLAVWIEPCLAQVYWTQETIAGNPSAPTAIHRTTLDGGSTQIFIDGLNHPTDIVIDRPAGFIYWTESIGDVIRRASLDGSGAQTLVGVNSPERLVTSSGANAMYWTGDGKLYHATLQGNSTAILADPASPVRQAEIMALDKGSQSGAIYYVESEYLVRAGTTSWVGQVFRFDAGQFSTKQYVTELGGSRPISIAVDEVNSHLYWSTDAGQIYRRSLGDQSTIVVSEGQYSRDLFVDYNGNKLWWTWEQGPGGQSPVGGISSVSLQGGAISSFSVPFRPQGIWVVPEPTALALASLASFAVMCLRASS